MTRTDRTARALAIRDHLLPLIRARGAIHESSESGLRVVVWRTGRFDFLLRSPFAPLPDAAPKSYAASLFQLPWGLDVVRGCKVLSLQWDDAGRVEVISFTRGAWEAEALAMGAADPSPGA